MQRNTDDVKVKHVDKITEKRYRDSSATDITQTIVDMYGRLMETQNKTSGSSDSQNIYYNYQTNGAHPLTTKVKEVFDIKGGFHTFNYDENNNPYGYNVYNSDKGNFKVNQVSSNATQYEFANSTRTSEITYEDSANALSVVDGFMREGKKVHIQPRIHKTVDKLSVVDGFMREGKKVHIQPRIHKTVDKNADFNDKQKEFEYKYAYDKLGRLSMTIGGEIVTQNSVADTKIQSIARKSYEKSTGRIHSTEYVVTNYARALWFNYNEIGDEELRQTYTYDEKGNIGTITEKGSVDNRVLDILYDSGDVTNFKRKTTYTYDEQNRIKAENVADKAGSQTSNSYIDYIYVNNRLNVVRSSLPSGLPSSKSFSYDNNGRRDGCNGQAITYDNYGNVIQNLGKALTWNSRNLLIKNNNVDYEYDYQGVLSRRRVNAQWHNMYNDGSRLLGETWGLNERFDYFL